MPSEQPVVSFLIAAFRAGDSLPVLVEKLLEQGGGSRFFELVISPDCPLDYPSLLPRDDRIVFAPAGVASGPSAARNRALRAARGTHVCLLDSDDSVGDGFMAGVRAALAVHEAFCLRTIYEAEGRLFKRYEGGVLDYRRFAAYYGSMQPVVPRSWIPEYPDYVAEDVLVTIAALYRAGGSLPVIDAVYIAKLRQEGFCARNAASFSRMYQEALEAMPSIALGLGVPGALPYLLEAFQARLDMSRAFDAYVAGGGVRGYHDFAPGVGVQGASVAQ